jgi:L-fuconolactonase
MIKIIDPHLHLFDLIKGDYQWLRPENPPFWSDKQLIAKSFTEQDLALTTPLVLAGFVHIEAGFDNQQPWREIAWLENTCNLPFRSVAMLDITLAPTSFTQQLDNLIRYQSVVGIRYILDGNALCILSDKNSQTNLATLAANKLSFELQMSLTDTPALEQLLTILALIPDLLVCINHAGWPMPDNVQHSLWLKNLKRLAKFNHVFIKCSGYEMTDRAYSASWQYKIVSQCVEIFGVERVMLASNFPLSLFHESYQDTWVANTALPFSTAQLQQLCFGNAHSFYQF